MRDNFRDTTLQFVLLSCLEGNLDEDDLRKDLVSALSKPGKEPTLPWYSG